ncbi:uncharacterized protein I206_102491 [Kwoniella pini CBS 10737]|uniref:SCP domain-containing protein n=1 Tax=Kwoniella pini CBS 10737 TaxID=1296096 RepID=A0AAJ8L1Y2_9TREE
MTKITQLFHLFFLLPLLTQGLVLPLDNKDENPLGGASQRGIERHDERNVFMRRLTSGTSGKKAKREHANIRIIERQRSGNRGNGCGGGSRNRTGGNGRGGRNRGGNAGGVAAGAAGGAVAGGVIADSANNNATAVITDGTADASAIVSDTAAVEATPSDTSAAAAATATDTVADAAATDAAAAVNPGATTAISIDTTSVNATGSAADGSAGNSTEATVTAPPPEDTATIQTVSVEGDGAVATASAADTGVTQCEDMAATAAAGGAGPDTAAAANAATAESGNGSAAESTATATEAGLNAAATTSTAAHSPVGSAILIGVRDKLKDLISSGEIGDNARDAGFSCGSMNDFPRARSVFEDRHRSSMNHALCTSGFMSTNRAVDLGCISRLCSPVTLTYDLGELSLNGIGEGR